jgi:acyl-CoA synthetase (AMP-forming)/AMP-acid ligase II
MPNQHCLQAWPSTIRTVYGDQVSRCNCARSCNPAASLDWTCNGDSCRPIADICCCKPPLQERYETTYFAPFKVGLTLHMHMQASYKCPLHSTKWQQKQPINMAATECWQLLPLQGFYFSGDGCRRDEDGYYWITGRVDDVS